MPTKKVRKPKAETDTSTSSGKDTKNVTLGEEAMVAPPTGPTFAATGGWESTYWWHGEDNIAKATGATDTNGRNTSSVWYGRVSAEWKGIAAYAGYLQTADKVLPRYSTSKKYYEEVQLGLSYTLGLFRDLDLTAGYNAFFLPESSFLNHKYQGEAFARLAYKGIPYVTPSLSAFYEHADSPGEGPHVDLSGGWIYEARVDGNFKLFDFGHGGSVGLNPFVTLVYNQGYWLTKNGIPSLGLDANEFYSIQYGLNVPVKLTQSLTLNLDGNLHTPLISRNSLIKQPDFWGGASLTYKF
jgi:hypothetical protein